MRCYLLSAYIHYSYGTTIILVSLFPFKKSLKVSFLELHLRLLLLSSLFLVFFPSHLHIIGLLNSWFDGWLNACLISFNFCFHKITVLQQWINIESTWNWQHYTILFHILTYVYFFYIVFIRRHFFMGFSSQRVGYRLMFLLYIIIIILLSLFFGWFVLSVDCSFHQLVLWFFIWILSCIYIFFM